MKAQTPISIKFSFNNQSPVKSGRHYDRICTYCKNHGKSEVEFTSHFLRETKSETSPYTCPEIMKIQCKTCQAKGRYHIGHYKSQCPFKSTDAEVAAKAAIPAFPPGLQLYPKDSSVSAIGVISPDKDAKNENEFASLNLFASHPFLGGGICGGGGGGGGASTYETNSAPHSAMKAEKKIYEKFCLFCKRQGKSEEEYSSHFLRETKDPTSKYTCPEILQVQCSNCFNNGRYHYGHYLNQCPFKTDARVPAQSFKHHDFPDFDEEKILKQIMNCQKYKHDPTYKYYQRSADEIKSFWADKRAACRASRGTSDPSLLNASDDAKDNSDNNEAQFASNAYAGTHSMHMSPNNNNNSNNIHLPRLGNELDFGANMQLPWTTLGEDRLDIGLDCKQESKFLSFFAKKAEPAGEEKSALDTSFEHVGDRNTLVGPFGLFGAYGTLGAFTTFTTFDTSARGSNMCAESKDNDDNTEKPSYWANEEQIEKWVSSMDRDAKF